MPMAARQGERRRDRRQHDLGGGQADRQPAGLARPRARPIRRGRRPRRGRPTRAATTGRSRAAGRRRAGSAQPSGGAPKGPVSNRSSSPSDSDPAVVVRDAGEGLPARRRPEQVEAPGQVEHDGDDRRADAAATSARDAGGPEHEDRADRERQGHRRRRRRGRRARASPTSGEQQAEPEHLTPRTAGRAGPRRRRRTRAGSRTARAGWPGQRQQHPRCGAVEEQAAPRPAARARCRARGWRRRRRAPRRRLGATRWAGQPPGAVGTEREHAEDQHLAQDPHRRRGTPCRAARAPRTRSAGTPRTRARPSASR